MEKQRKNKDLEKIFNSLPHLDDMETEFGEMILVEVMEQIDKLRSDLE